ncbi:hypothetical protein BZA70DRAFT_27156 [Myxozyma melibiosi]|uniref:RRM domain-containing protein n=1 Tax=Myxozyma melibiosi TaxID=54550 RepID=A0ABR1FFN0_9ASCO
MSDTSEPRRSQSPETFDQTYDVQPPADDNDDPQSYDNYNADAASQSYEQYNTETANASENPPSVNLFVSGLHPKIDEQEFKAMFDKYAAISAHIMKDPHTRESRGFGFIGFPDIDAATSAKSEMQGIVVEGRSIQIEFAKRNRPRTPTPGKYFGQVVRGGRGDFRGRGGRFPSSFDDRGGGSFGGRPRYDDRPYARHDDRDYHRHHSRHEDVYREREPVRSVVAGRPDYRDRLPVAPARYDDRREYDDRRSYDRRPPSAPYSDRYDRGAYPDRDHDRRRDYSDRPARGYHAGPSYDRPPYPDRGGAPYSHERDYPDRPAYPSRGGYADRADYPPQRPAYDPRDAPRESASYRDPYPPSSSSSSRAPPAIPTGPAGAYPDYPPTGPRASGPRYDSYRGSRRY